MIWWYERWYTLTVILNNLFSTNYFCSTTIVSKPRYHWQSAIKSNRWPLKRMIVIINLSDAYLFSDLWRRNSAAVNVTAIRVPTEQEWVEQWLASSETRVSANCTSCSLRQGQQGQQLQKLVFPPSELHQHQPAEGRAWKRNAVRSITLNWGEAGYERSLDWTLKTINVLSWAERYVRRTRRTLHTLPDKIWNNWRVSRRYFTDIRSPKQKTLSGQHINIAWAASTPMRMRGRDAWWRTEIDCCQDSTTRVEVALYWLHAAIAYKTSRHSTETLVISESSVAVAGQRWVGAIHCAKHLCTAD